MDWDALRCFHAVVRTGSVTAAARDLGLAQPTVGRRIAALEAQLQTRLFLRQPRGMVPTPAGESILAAARQMEEAAQAAERRIAGRGAALAGTVRISAAEGTGIQFLPHRLAPFRERHPGITVQIVVDNGTSDLARRDADIAIRMYRPTEPSLVARRIGRLGTGLYAARAYLARRGLPASVADLRQHDVIGMDRRLPVGPHIHWLLAQADDQKLAFATNSLLGQAEAAAAGWGIAALTHLTARRLPDLVPVLPDAPTPVMDVWLAVHEDVRASTAVRAVHAELATVLKRHASELETGIPA